MCLLGVTKLQLFEESFYLLKAIIINFHFQINPHCP